MLHFFCNFNILLKGLKLLLNDLLRFRLADFGSPVTKFIGECTQIYALRRQEGSGIYFRE
jgi:hypothetical protein